MPENPPPTYRLRQGLEFSPQQHQGKSFVVVKDPVTARYFRFTETQAVILECLCEPIDAPSPAARVSEWLGGSVTAAGVDWLLCRLGGKWRRDTPGPLDTLSPVAR